MKSGLKYVVAFAAAFALMFTVRTLLFSIHGVSGSGLAPLFSDGDRLLVNRCCYGVRIAGNRLLPYSRLMRRAVRRGDVVAFTVAGGNDDGVMIARCTAVPGDTLHTLDGPLLVPGRNSCADADYYWLESLNPQNPADSRHLGFISERAIIGRVTTVLYNTRRTSSLLFHHSAP